MSHTWDNTLIEGTTKVLEAINVQKLSSVHVYREENEEMNLPRARRSCLPVCLAV